MRRMVIHSIVDLRTLEPSHVEGNTKRPSAKRAKKHWPMMLSRRIFLSAAVYFGLSGCAQHRADRARLLFSGATDGQGQHYLVGANDRGETDFKIPVQERVHDSFYMEKAGKVIFIGRSPSTSFYVVDTNTKTLIRTGAAPAGRFFSGHGVMSHHLLHLPESDIESRQGFIGLYDSQDQFRRVGGFSTHGIEPHQLALLNTSTIVVANGGVFKDKQGRVKNPNNIHSSIVFMDIQSGTLLQKNESPSSTLSLRHLVIGEDDLISIGAQSHSESIEPLICSLEKGGQLKWMKADDALWMSHVGYTASLSRSGDTLLVTSPRGNGMSFWDVNTHEYKQFYALRDCAGAVAITAATATSIESLNAAKPTDYFWVSSSSGLLQKLALKKVSSIFSVETLASVQCEVSWDNHLT